MSGFRWPAADKVPRFPREKTSGTQGKSDKTIYTTSNNQSLRSAGDNNRKSKDSKRFCSNTVSSDKRVIEGPNPRDHIALCTFDPFLVEVQMNDGYIHATHA